MRISDWSSDVCSSDLNEILSGCRRFQGDTEGRPSHSGDPELHRFGSGGRAGSAGGVPPVATRRRPSGLEHACHERHGLSAGHFGRSRWAAAENRLLHDRKRHGAYPRGDRRRGGRIHHEAVRPGNPRDQAFAGWLCLIPPGELVMAVHNLGDREPGPDAAPIRVAIVDDSTVARTMMGWTLEKAGMDVVATASNGREAISALATANIDVLVLDLEMPHMDGLSALPELLSASQATVLVVSALTTEGAYATIEALRLGAAATLAKPGAMLGGDTSRSFGAMLVEKIRDRKSTRLN